MKKILLAAALMLVPTYAISEEYNYKILRVLDGDTVEIEAPFLPKELKKVLHLRVYGVDTPEKGSLAKCDLERSRSLEAKDFVQKEISLSKHYSVILYKWDKYGGRVLGDVILDGEKLSEKLIKNNYAVNYFGGKKIGWCK